MSGLTVALTWHSFDTWIIVIGVLCAAACALPGSFLVLRRQSMMGDAISHAVLPGLAAAFLLTESRSSIVMFIGAAAVGVVTAVVTQWVHASGKVERSAAMGVVFTTLFAIGLVMIVRAADKVDLDPGCVLYGSIELAPLDTLRLAGFDVPRAAAVLAAVLLGNVLIIGLLFKEMTISSFDQELATSLGFSARMMNFILMTLVAITTVAAFEAIGSILVIAMLIVPPATARLLTHRLAPMVIIAAALGALAAASGHVAAITLPPLLGFEDTLTSGMMAVAAGALFVLAMVFSPQQGIVSGMLHRRALSLRIAIEDALGLLYRAEESKHPLNEESLTARLRADTGVSRRMARQAVARLRRDALIDVAGDRIALTPAGHQQARAIIRSHRLWESYLAEHMQVPEGHLHDTAMQLEHHTTPPMQAALAEVIGDPPRDPQNKPIPPADQP